VLFFEIIYSIRFKEFLPKIKIQNNLTRTDTVPSIYFFLYEISKFIKNNNIKSIVDVGSGYGRVVNFISSINKIKSYGIEFDAEVHRSALKIKRKNVKLYNGDIFKFDIKKFNSKCFILVDPFQKIKDRNKFLSKVKKIFPKNKKYIIAINNYKGKFPKDFKLIYSLIGSKTRSLKIYEII
jgi:SAM-dependent methyltransferase